MKALQKASSHVKNGENLEAEALYRKMVLSFPNITGSLEALANLREAPEHGHERQLLRATIDQLLQMFNRGQFKKVMVAAAALSDQYPTEVAILNLLGISSAQLGKLDHALQAFEKMAVLDPNRASTHFNIGNALKDQGRIEDAIDAYTRALSINPEYKPAANNLVTALKSLGNMGENRLKKLVEVRYEAKANSLLKTALDLQLNGKLERAIKGYKEAIAIKPDYADAFLNMGTALADQGKLEEAMEAFSKALAIKPDYASAHNNMGNALKDQGKLAQAIERYKKAIAIKPDYADAFLNIGTALADQGRPDEAIEAYKKALSIKPNYAASYYNMGNALKDQGKMEEAIEAYKKVIIIKPDYVEAFLNMGVALAEIERKDNALEAYHKALAINPHYTRALSNIGVIEADKGNLEAAIKAYNKALAVDPDDAEARHNKSLVLLKNKIFDQGFKENEWRWKTNQKENIYRIDSKPSWTGEKNKRVLVWSEQGIGDVVMYSSMIRELHDISSKIVVQCDSRLIPLFQRSFPPDIIYCSKDQIISKDDYDFHIPIGSLPLYFRKSLDSFRNSALGYLKADISQTANFRAQLFNKRMQGLVGLSWRTNSKAQSSKQRNVPLSGIVRALTNKNYRLINLQYGYVADEIKDVKEELGIEIISVDGVDNQNDIDKLAALMSACDMVVTIDNTTAHLSGALGLPTKLMLPAVSNWRWTASDDDSYWYDSIKIYRKSEVHTWESVLEQL